MAVSDDPKKQKSIAGILFLSFCLIFSWSMSDTVITDMIVFKTCVVTLKIPLNECEILHTNGSSEAAKNLTEIIHPEIASLLATKFLIEVPLPTILSLFLGPWSDKFGRKPLFLLPFTGLFFNYFALMIFSQTNLSPFYYLISSICGSVFGSFAVLIVVFICYASDISESEKKAWNLSLVDIFLCLGSLAGLALSPLIFHNFGYFPVFVSSASICLVACIFSVLCLEETIQYTGNENRMKQLFDPSLVKELVVAVTKKRENFDRLTVWCCFACLMSQVAFTEGGNSIGYLFCSARLGWNVANYSIYMIASTSLAIIGYIISLQVAASILGISYPLLAIMASILEITGSAIKAFAYLSWHLYVTPFLSMFSGSAIPILKAIVVENIPETDTGKVFSLITSMMMMLLLVSNPVYMMVYSNFMPPKYYPCPVWFLTCFFCTVIMCLSVIIETRTRAKRREAKAKSAVEMGEKSS